MTYTELTPSHIPQLLPLYTNYYNTYEDGQWTPSTAESRIRQVLTMNGGYGLALWDRDVLAGFAMGFFQTYDDLTAFVLEEILVAKACQSQGLGSALLAETEARVRARGAAGMELKAVNDPMHLHFYGKAGFGQAKNFVCMVKWFNA